MRLYISAFIVLALVLVTHLLGMHGLYLRYAWYDIFMHMFGGVGIGLFASAVIWAHARDLIKKRTTIVICVLIAGVLWELFEVRYDIAGYHFATTLYYIDTVKDLIDDVLGGAVIAYLFGGKAHAPAPIAEKPQEIVS